MMEKDGLELILEKKVDSNLHYNCVILLLIFIMTEMLMKKNYLIIIFGLLGLIFLFLKELLPQIHNRLLCMS
jgi:hypothetical protein